MGYTAMIVERNASLVAKVYAAQDKAIMLLEAVLRQNPQARLSGGTVLSRLWLKHRLSFDLDFFVPPGFDMDNLAAQLKKIGFSTSRYFKGDNIYSQLFGQIGAAGSAVAVSFIEDRFYKSATALSSTAFPFLRIEYAASIYRRKARIIMGLTEGTGRNAARDIFDLFCLSRQLEPIDAFAPRNFGEEGYNMFLEGLALVDPLKLLDDDQFITFGDYPGIRDGVDALAALMELVNMATAPLEEAWQSENQETQIQAKQAQIDNGAA